MKHFLFSLTVLATLSTVAQADDNEEKLKKIVDALARIERTLDETERRIAELERGHQRITPSVNVSLNEVSKRRQELGRRVSTLHNRPGVVDPEGYRAVSFRSKNFFFRDDQIVEKDGRLYARWRKDYEWTPEHPVYYYLAISLDEYDFPYTGD